LLPEETAGVEAGRSEEETGPEPKFGASDPCFWTTWLPEFEKTLPCETLPVAPRMAHGPAMPESKAFVRPDATTLVLRVPLRQLALSIGWAVDTCVRRAAESASELGGSNPVRAPMLAWRILGDPGDIGGKLQSLPDIDMAAVETHLFKGRLSRSGVPMAPAELHLGRTVPAEPPDVDALDIVALVWKPWDQE